MRLPRTSSSAAPVVEGGDDALEPEPADRDAVAHASGPARGGTAGAVGLVRRLDEPLHDRVDRRAGIAPRTRRRRRS